MKIKSLLFTFMFTFICAGLLPAQDLINAVKTGSIKEVKKLLPYENMEEKDENNCTAYHWTAILGDKKMAELLLQNGADPNALVTDIPSKRISANETIYAGSVMGAPSAAVLAEENGNNKLIDFFLSKGNINKHLRSAVMCDNKVVTGKAIKAGGDPNMSINMAGDRLLTAAIELSFDSGSDEMIDTLIENGADISAAFGSSFVYGSVAEDSKTWEKMLDKGADINQTFHDNNYDTTLPAFAYKKDSKKLDFLVKHGVDLTVKYKNGRTLLHNAVEAQTKVHLLIPPSDICDKACMINYLSIRDDNGETPCDIANRKLRNETREYAKENAQDIVNLVCDNTIENEVIKSYRN